jgi:hypothetical protein
MDLPNSILAALELVNRYSVPGLRLLVRSSLHLIFSDRSLPGEIKIHSLSQLEAVLHSYNIDMSVWGKPVSSLLQEINDDETVLVDCGGVLEMHTNTVLVEILSPDDSMRLVEEKQVFTNGFVRYRRLVSLSEKFRPGESPTEAAYRAISEELLERKEFDQSSVQLLSLPIPTSFYKPSAESYPGLKTVNRLFRFRTILPGDLYDQNGYIEIQRDKKTYFKWIPVNMVEVFQSGEFG